MLAADTSNELEQLPGAVSEAEAPIFLGETCRDFISLVRDALLGENGNTNFIRHIRDQSISPFVAIVR